MCSLSILSSLTSLGGNETDVNGLDGTASLALLANEVIYTLLFLVPNSRLVRVAIDTLNVVIGVPSNRLREVLGLITTRKDHLTIVADDTDATQLGQEVSKNMGLLTIERLSLLQEVVPARLGGRLGRLSSQQRERLVARVTTGSLRLDHVDNILQHLDIRVALLAFDDGPFTTLLVLVLGGLAILSLLLGLEDLLSLVSDSVELRVGNLLLLLLLLFLLRSRAEIHDLNIVVGTGGGLILLTNLHVFLGAFLGGTLFPLRRP